MANTKKHKGSENLKPGQYFKDKDKAIAAGKRSVIAKREKRKISEYLSMLMEKEYPVKNEDGKSKTTTGAEILATILVKKAMQGDTRVISELMDRLEGKAIQKTEVTGADGNPLSPAIINIIPVKSK